MPGRSTTTSTWRAAKTRCIPVLRVTYAAAKGYTTLKSPSAARRRLSNTSSGCRVKNYIILHDAMLLLKNDT